ncbi:hypothetical protein HCD_06560 [Helicobacter cetorum MIT 99-5656]|uniref:Uncharacterized protein n=1 Tax=Helicobacter cetorum (strain ATCC BAA-540 / CCUG 52418 / MIT 99-5656) TaxID=1163745 RepID=I0ETP5_HELCM|nr:hypothetical protein HCD_06560 [Helicobacter cetorum MIT 99-5656]
MSLEYQLELFMKKKTTNLNDIDKYVIYSIQTEATTQETMVFTRLSHSYGEYSACPFYQPLSMKLD